MESSLKYNFSLPPEDQVIKRNRTITTYYAQLYKQEPQLYKWAGMAAFASFHIGEKLQMWNWEDSGLIKENWSMPKVTNLQYRWYWIFNDLLKKWKIVEGNDNLIKSEINLLAKMEDRNLRI